MGFDGGVFFLHQFLWIQSIVIAKPMLPETHVLPPQYSIGFLTPWSNEPTGFLQQLVLSLAESHWYRSMGAGVIGMTNMPEAKLAREAQIAYASLATVTDYDCWHPREAHVTTELAHTALGTALTPMDSMPENRQSSYGHCWFELGGMQGRTGISKMSCPPQDL